MIGDVDIQCEAPIVTTERPTRAPTQPTVQPTRLPTTEPAFHYVAQGRTSWEGWHDSPDYYCQNDEDNQAAYGSSYHGLNIGVGCCSEDGLSGYRPDCDAHPATYHEAVAVCSEYGYRLC